MKVMICGAGGQLGWELQRTAPSDIDLLPFTSQQLDITRGEQVADTVAGIRPGLIINGAAYTAVDRAEQERDLAFAVNGRGVANLAESARQCGGRLLHISTDFVFDGRKSYPYLPTDETNPLSVYGASKREGEKLALAILPDVLIVRTAWVYSAHGANFVKTMLRLMNGRETIGVVADQTGSPTWANGMARTLWQLNATGLRGIHHWTDSGVASWYDFAVAIHEEASQLGLVNKEVAVLPIGAKDYPTPASRPFYSVLDRSSSIAALNQSPPHWRKQLRLMLREIRDEKDA